MAVEQTILIALVGGAIGTLILASIAFALAFLLGLYIYFAIAWFTIAKKLKYKRSWLAWVPFASTAMVLELGKFNWALVFLYLIPVLGWIALLVLTIIAKWRIFEKRKYPGWLSLFILIPKFGFIAHAAIIGLVAWKKNK